MLPLGAFLGILGGILLLTWLVVPAVVVASDRCKRSCEHLRTPAFNRLQAG